ncbi:autotransporter outer membrane beta-barrel domain-containing protein [Variovorax paradoxus]|uniref:Outer membrane protein IcsA autotransporter n=1 Tax=Variovorax paradoxus TaxID=34073 RepID=A0A679JBU5_VARPD|nr:Outer membrane protein IcsA autotransporter [Variovorax paradoxus]
MNTIFKSVWNASAGAWVAAPETSKANGKSSASRPVATALLAFAGMACSPAYAVCTSSALGITCSGAANPLAPSFSNGTDNLNVTVNPNATVGVLSGVGGIAMSLTGSNLTLTNNGKIDPTAVGGTPSKLSSGVFMGNAGFSTQTVTNNGILGGTSGVALGLTGLALTIQNGDGGTTSVTNTGTMATTGITGATLVGADAGVMALYGGGQVHVDNTGTITGRVALESSAGGNTFTNAGILDGSVSLGANSTNTFVATTDSKLLPAVGSAPSVDVAVGAGSLHFAATGFVDGGAGGDNTLKLVQGTATDGAISHDKYLNFNHLAIDSGRWVLRGASAASDAALRNGAVAAIDDAAGLGTGTVRSNGGAIEFSTAGLTLSNKVDLLAGGLSLRGGVDATLSGVISGTGALTQSGTGTVTLGNSNGYSGGTAILGGALQVSSDASLGDPTGAVRVNDASLRAGASFTLARDVYVVNYGTLDTGAFDVTMTGAIRNDGVFGALRKAGSGTLTLQNGGSDYTDGTFVDAGTLALKGAGNIGSYALNVATGATFDISQLAASGGQANFILGGGRIALGGKTLTTYNGASVSTFGGVIADGGIGGGTGGALHITDAGDSWTLTNAQTYTGGTILDAGNLILSGNGALASGGALTLGAAAHVDVSGTKASGLTLGNVSGSGSISLGAKALTLGTADNIGYAGAIDGAGGSLVKQGVGELVLDGINSYTGTTSVNAGTLVVGGTAGSKASIAGDAMVASGATLGGHGTIGGNATVSSGATLAPGHSIGTLNVLGDLTLQKGAVLNFEFGAPGSSFQSFGLGDNVAVGGNLSIDSSTLNVVDAGGMGPGLYNLFSYKGALSFTNGGFTPPAGSSLQILTVDKQINLVHTAGYTLNVWNANGLASETQMGGGSGTWSAASSNFTDATGSVTAPMQPAGGFAVFGGAPGTVTIDNGAGAVRAGGMQFASDGYRLTGDALTLAADVTHVVPVEVRVGDGSAASANWTATIANVLTGSDGLNKTGAGTLVLTGVNIYTGGTTVTAGVLQGDTVSLRGDILNNATVNFYQAVPGSYAGTMSGGGVLRKIGNGDLVLSAPNSYQGGTRIDAGSLNASVSGALGTGPVNVAGNASLIFSGTASAGALNIAMAAGSGVVNGGLAQFNDKSSAGSATLVAQAGGSIVFGNNATAADATIENRGGQVTIWNNATAGQAKITNVGGATNLLDNGSAGQATITNEVGGALDIYDTATADKATVINNAGGVVRIRSLTTPGVSIGSLQGAGRVLLGNKTLNVGGLNTSTEISGVISDAGGSIVKVGSGKLTLSGANTYTGGTALKEGRLDVGHSQALGTGALAMDDGTTLGLSADGVNIANAIRLTGTSDPVIDTGAFSGTLSGDISGGGFLTKEGTGTLTLAGVNTFTGSTNVAQGTLRAAATGTFSASSAHSVAAGATLDLAGFNQTVASLANGGTVSLAGAAAGTTLTVNGNYVGNNGVLKLGTALNGTGPSDRLVINGGTATGKTSVQIANLGGLGALTSGNGIEVVTAQGGATTTAQTTKDAFSLAGGHVDAGAYEYRLYAADAGGAGENWFLRSTAHAATPGAMGGSSVVTYRPEAALYASLPSQLRQGNLAMLGDLRKRVGDDDVKGAATSPTGSDRRAWARVLSTDIDIRQGGAVSPTSKGRLTGFQAGTDLLAMPGWRAGLYVGQLDGDARTNGFASGIQNLAVGRNDLRSQYVGVYGTYTSDTGFHADAVVQSGRHRYTVEPLASVGVGGKGHSLLGSIEIGQSFALGAGGWHIEPQLQLIHQHMDLGNSAIAGAIAQPQADSGWIARAGVRVKGEIDTGLGTLQPYGRFNVYKSSGGADIARFVNGTTATGIAAPTGSTSSELAGGFTLALSTSTSVYGEIGKLWASGGDAKVRSSVNGSVGVRVKW